MQDQPARRHHAERPPGRRLQGRDRLRLPIQVRFTDLNDNLYSFAVEEAFAACPEATSPSLCPTHRAAVLKSPSCRLTGKGGELHPRSSDWCLNANPNQQREKQLTTNGLSVPQPADFMP